MPDRRQICGLAPGSRRCHRNRVQASSLWFDLSKLSAEERSILILEGKDAPRFVQGLISADVKSMDPQVALPASLLTVKAKLLSDAIVWLETPERFALAVPKSRAEAMRDHVDRHIIMDELTVVLDAERGLALQSGTAQTLPSGVDTLVRRCAYPLPGLLWVGTPAALSEQGREIAAGDAADFDRLRIEAGVPAWGRELSEQRLPPEAGFTPSISYSKGCFMGQEPLARIHARGQVNRVLVRLRSEPTPTETLPLTLEAKDAKHGVELTTWCASQGQGLGIAHRSLANPGQVLFAQDRAFEVVSEPLGDDPGIKSPR